VSLNNLRLNRSIPRSISQSFPFSDLLFKTLHAFFIFYLHPSCLILSNFSEKVGKSAGSKVTGLLALVTRFSSHLVSNDNLKKGMYCY
jgi:hypothetical protein